MEIYEITGLFLRKDNALKLLEKCPICGGELVEKEVEKVLKGGANTAVLKVKAEVCLHCGERLYRPKTVSHFEEIREKLSNEDVGECEPVGKTYQVA
jgi:YgiT-type zinc finger domain-containing protein